MGKLGNRNFKKDKERTEIPRNSMLPCNITTSLGLLLHAGIEIYVVP